jgi:hypothetical protein
MQAALEPLGRWFCVPVKVAFWALLAKDAFRKALGLMKKSFVRRELPRLFRTMDLLQLNCEDLRALYAGSTRGKTPASEEERA